jgi:hypothetical protein
MIKEYENKMLKPDKKKVRIKIKSPLKNYKPGDVLTITVYKEGIPIIRYWRDRLKDAKIDGCIELIQDQLKPVSEKKQRKKRSVSNNNKPEN